MHDASILRMDLTTNSKQTIDSIMADSFGKKEREKKRRKRKQEKAERKKQKKLEGVKTSEFMYVDADGNLTETPPDPTVKREEIKLEDIAISTPKKTEEDELSNIRTGFLKFFNREKHFGFITEESTGIDYFVHGADMTGEIHENDNVIFELGSSPKGPAAIKVSLRPKAPPPPPEPKEEVTEAPESSSTETAEKKE